MSQLTLNTVIDRQSIPGFYRVGEQTVSVNDTIKLSDFISISNSHVLSLADGSNVLHSRSGNVITITQSVSNIRVVVLAWGRK